MKHALAFCLALAARADFWGAVVARLTPSHSRRSPPKPAGASAQPTHPPTATTMKTDKRDEALIEDIARYFDILASNSEAMAARGIQKRENTMSAKVWREAAEDVRSFATVTSLANTFRRKTGS